MEKIVGVVGRWVEIILETRVIGLRSLSHSSMKQKACVKDPCRGAKRMCERVSDLRVQLVLTI